MKKIIKRKRLILLLIIGLIVVCTSVYYAEVLYDSQIVGYDNSSSGLTSKTVKGGLDELFEKAKNTACYFQVGDYFSLTPDAIQSYNRYRVRVNTGLGNEWYLDPTELTLWRVIMINSDGSFEAVSEYVSSLTISWSGDTAYQDYPGSLQTLSAKYHKAGYIVGSRMMGYAGQRLHIQYYYDENSSQNCSETLCADNSVCRTTTDYPLKCDPSYLSSTSTGTPITGIGQEYSGGILGDTLYLRDIQLVGNVYKSDPSTYGTDGLKATQSDGTETRYWIASRSYTYSSTGTTIQRKWGVRYVSMDGSIMSMTVRQGETSDGTTTWNNTISGQAYSAALRPIITLRSGITIASGAGTKASPYILN